MNTPPIQPKSWDELGIEIPHGQSGEIDTTCPKCSHTRKKKNARCLSVNTDTGLFYCNHCGESGSKDFGWKDDPDRPRRDLPPTRPKEYRKPKPLPPTPPPSEAGEPPNDAMEAAWDDYVRYCAGRGISELTMRRNRLTVTQHYMAEANNGDGETLWVLCFPYLDGDEHVNTKYRTGAVEGIPKDDAKLFQMSGGAKRIVYGLNDLIDQEVAFIVEGEFDKLAMEEAGLVNVISVPDGAPAVNAKNYDSKFAFMDDITERFDTVHKWVIAVDNDEPGRKLAEELVRRLGSERCWRVDWTKAETKDHPVKDANDALLLWGKKAFRDRLKAVTSRWPVDGLFEIKSFHLTLLDRYHNGPKKALSTGWDTMDGAYRVLPGTLTLVTAPPNIGKSTFLNAMTVNLSMQHDFRWAVCSPEWRPMDDMIQAMIKVFTGKPFDKWHKNRMTVSEFQYAEDWLHERIQFVYPEIPTIESVLKVADVALKRIGIRGLIIDPWSELETSRFKPPGISQTDWIGQNLQTIRRWLETRDVAGFLVVHPTKLELDDQGEFPVPSMYDMSGSAKFADMADFVLALWRSNFDDEGKMEVHVKKARYRHAAKRNAVVDLWFDPTTERFSTVQDGIGTTGTTEPWNLGNTSLVAD